MVLSYVSIQVQGNVTRNPLSVACLLPITSKQSASSHNSGLVWASLHHDLQELGAVERLTETNSERSSGLVRYCRHD